MKRFKLFLDFDKEETWLNAMAREGWLLERKGVRYRFRRIEPGSAVVRVDYRPGGMSHADFADYRTLFADAGWQHLHGARGGGPQYFAAFDPRASAEIFSDSTSRADRYRRAIAFRFATVLPLAVVLFALGMQDMITLSPRELYLTPGLWDMQGGEFALRFLFETPFALLRAAPLIIIVALAVLVVQIVMLERLRRRATSS